jgi:myo-inositol-1(or 4)-monophosphatase
MGKPGHGQFLKELHQISQKVAGVRRFGAAALDLAWVAAGRFDGYWERNLNAWDVAAGVLLVTESRRQGLDHRGARQPGRGRLDPGRQPGPAPAGAGKAAAGLGQNYPGQARHPAVSSEPAPGSALRLPGMTAF